MTVVGEAFIAIRPQTDGFEADLDKNVTGKVRGAAGTIAKVIGGAFALKAGASILGGFISDARDSEKVGKQTEQVIRSTGNAAHVTADQMGELAGSISKKTGVDDEAIQSAENLLRTFTGVRNETKKGTGVFGEATKAIVDMSAVQGDLQSNALLVGKALQNPVEGLTALQRVGVKLSDQQKQQVKDFVAVGDVASAQRVILKELGTEFGGQAEAQATASDKLKVSMGNLSESIGTLLVPVMNTLSVVGTDVTEFLTNLSPTGKVLIGVVAGLAAAVVVIIEVSKAWTAAQVALNIVLSANPIGLIIIAIAAFVAGIVLAYQKVGWFRDLVDGAFHLIQAVIVGVFDWVTKNWPLLLVVLTGPFGLAVVAIQKNWDTVKGVVSGVFDWVKDHWPLLLAILTGPFGLAVFAIRGHVDQIVGFFTDMPGRISGAAHGMWDGILRAFVTMLNRIISLWNNLDFKLPSVDTHIPGIGKIGGFTLGTPDLPLIKAASGFNGIVDRATLFLAGEAGRERVDIGSGGAQRTYQLHLNGPVAAELTDQRAVMEMFRRMEIMAGTP